MKFAQKMILVPAERPDPEQASLSTLDQAMSSVLFNKNLTNVEKVNLYQQILRKNLTLDAKIKQKSANTVVSKPMDTNDTENDEEADPIDTSSEASEATLDSEKIPKSEKKTTKKVKKLSEAAVVNLMDISGLNRLDVDGILDIDKTKRVKKRLVKSITRSPIHNWYSLRPNLNKTRGRKLSYAHKYSNDSFLVEPKQYKRKLKE